MKKEDREKAFIEVPFSLEVKELSEDSKFFQFEGYASTFGNIDLVDDIVVKGAFKNSLAKLRDNLNQLPVLWQHQRDMPLGVYFEIYEDEKGLFVKGKMPKNDTFVSGRVVPQMQIGSVTKMSIGFFIVKREFNEEGIRLLKEIDLFEVSLVTLPANDKADITGIKSIEDSKSLSDIEKNLRQHYSKKQSEAIISQIATFKKLDWDNQVKEKALALRDAESEKEFLQELKNLSLKFKQ